ncbi:MAG: hypothetical protein ACOYJY_01835 [Acutalibacteraceae bacterium]
MRRCFLAIIGVVSLLFLVSCQSTTHRPNFWPNETTKNNFDTTSDSASTHRNTVSTRTNSTTVFQTEVSKMGTTSSTEVFDAKKRLRELGALLSESHRGEIQLHFHKYEIEKDIVVKDWDLIRQWGKAFSTMNVTEKPFEHYYGGNFDMTIQMGSQTIKLIFEGSAAIVFPEHPEIMLRIDLPYDEYTAVMEASGL